MIDIRQNEQHKDTFLAINPKGALPVLELDDGRHITESLVIMEYLEELFPQPMMIGESPLERAQMRALERFIDTSICISFNGNIMLHHKVIYAKINTKDILK
ncbi:MAG TPA: glutathione S-transferase family protein [Methylococcaceae bacterium]|jgi:glutathione S-transferase|nr:glutathione S-transferase family protein [Methylococcaceae bacterium]